MGRCPNLTPVRIQLFWALFHAVAAEKADSGADRLHHLHEAVKRLVEALKTLERLEEDCDVGA